MPKRPVHRRTTKDILGEDYDYVHKWKDEPVWRRGAYHREVRHGPLAAYDVGRRFKGSGSFNFGAAAASIIHDLEDGHAATWITLVGGGLLGAWIMSRALPSRRD